MAMKPAGLAERSRAIRAHYNRLSRLYCRLWGEHIHHGYWTDGESAAEAQLALTAELARRARVSRNARVLDVGCGLGGSARWLACELDCSVTGITLSPVQRRMAEWRSRRAGLGDRVEFDVHDADQRALPGADYDVVWVLECCEHLENRARFVRECARVLEPGGVLALTTWCAAEPESGMARPDLIQAICDGMLCPELRPMNEHLRWMREAGFDPVEGWDLSRRVERTWDICAALVRRRWIRMLLPFMDKGTRRFTATFATMRSAYAADALIYGMFVARKPALGTPSAASGVPIASKRPSKPVPA